MNQKTFTVPANGQEIQSAVGQYTYALIRTASVQVQVSFDGDNWQTVSQNDNFGPLSRSYTRVYLKAANGQAANVTIIFSTTPISIQPGQTKLPPTYTKATDLSGGAALAAGANSVFTGTDNAGANQRKQITVQNCDAGGNVVEVQDGNGVSMAVLVAGQPPWTVETSGIVIVKNTNGTGVSRVLVGEIFYS
jgi:hypothetical protein